MHANNISVELALFWDQWATQLEKQRNYVEAEKIFKEGISRYCRKYYPQNKVFRNARPVDTLKRHMSKFFHRMANRALPQGNYCN